MVLGHGTSVLGVGQLIEGVIGSNRGEGWGCTVWQYPRALTQWHTPAAVSLPLQDWQQPRPRVRRLDALHPPRRAVQGAESAHGAWLDR